MQRPLVEPAGLLDKTHDGQALIESGRFAFMLGMAVDLMLFGGLVGAYFVLRGGALTWPPPEVPKLDPQLFFIATLMQINVSVGLAVMLRCYNNNAPKKMRAAVYFALFSALSFIFLVVSEWSHLHASGVQPTTVFGGIYVVLIGTFLLHVAVGTFFILRILMKTSRWSTYTRSGNSIPHTAYFFHLMTIVWAAIFPLIYF